MLAFDTVRLLGSHKNWPGNVTITYCRHTHDTLLNDSYIVLIVCSIYVSELWRADPNFI